MNIGSVRIKKTQLDYFRKLALRIEEEWERNSAYLLGRIVSPELVVKRLYHYTKTFRRPNGMLCYARYDE